jgi:hypothetical protein
MLVVLLGCAAFPALRTALTPSPLQVAAGTGKAAEAAVPHLSMLRTRASNPHLIEDENGRPFFIAGVCPQNIIHWCTAAQMDTYFADRHRIA